MFEDVDDFFSLCNYSNYKEILTRRYKSSNLVKYESKSGSVDLKTSLETRSLKLRAFQQIKHFSTCQCLFF
jgi:hypothetical protein